MALLSLHVPVSFRPPSTLCVYSVCLSWQHMRYNIRTVLLYLVLSLSLQFQMEIYQRQSQKHGASTHALLSITLLYFSQMIYSEVLCNESIR